VGTGTLGQVLTSAGAGADPLMQDPVTSTNATTNSLSASPLVVVNTDGVTYQDTGESIGLSQGGTYLFTFTVRSEIQSTVAGAFILFRLRNQTDSATVANSETKGAVASTPGVIYEATTSSSITVQLSGPKVINLQVTSFANGGVLAVNQLLADANGWSFVSTPPRGE